MSYDLHDARWRKSSFSADEQCVEVASNLPGVLAVRDSKDPAASALIFSLTEWSAFLDAVKSGRFTV
ncbi:DUF397 domain-containing protein [Sphaerisporangium sp. B11E5]|uniref:DUF397 domain-containing protein n=1 Tax=Sphaerisporangium sp. B11E5 TaxID=3153563 RepID=UPI00325E5942